MSASLIASRTAHFTACKGLLAQCGFRAVFFVSGLFQHNANRLVLTKLPFTDATFGLIIAC